MSLLMKLFQDSRVLFCAASGLFTSTSPELRRIVPEAEGRVRVKVVYVVLEAQYLSALSKTVNRINHNSDKVCFEIIGYLLEELRNPENYEQFKKDVAEANVFIGSLIFIEELADKVSSQSRVSIQIASSWLF